MTDFDCQLERLLGKRKRFFAFQEENVTHSEHRKIRNLDPAETVRAADLDALLEVSIRSNRPGPG
ncbi:MAG: hypothetical protein ACREVW_19125, partial [Burkholderiales bacterium]